MMMRRAFQNSKALASQGLHLRFLQILKQSVEPVKVSACCQALKKLCVNDEICKVAVAEAAVETTVKVEHAAVHIIL